MKKIKCWEVVVLILYNLLCYQGLPVSSAADGDVNIALSRAAAGFISIDCGMMIDSRYDENTGLYYSSDAGFIDTGENVELPYYEDNRPLYDTVRSFPDGLRNCYTLKPSQGNNSNYLIRAKFKYGNYDGPDKTPEFDLYVGVTYWDTVRLEIAERPAMFDLIYAPSEDIIYVCLVNTGQGTPFISALELKPLNNSIYKSSAGGPGAVRLVNRYVSSMRRGLPLYTSEADDPYDRFWAPFSAALNWGNLTTFKPMNST